MRDWDFCRESLDFNLLVSEERERDYFVNLEDSSYTNLNTFTDCNVDFSPIRYVNTYNEAIAIPVGRIH